MNNAGSISSNRSRSLLFLIGKNSNGGWVARDQSGLCGGLFVNRAAALKFAMFENGHQPRAVIMVPGTLELNSASSDVAGTHASVKSGTPSSNSLAIITA